MKAQLFKKDGQLFLELAYENESQFDRAAYNEFMDELSKMVAVSLSDEKKGFIIKAIKASDTLL